MDVSCADEPTRYNLGIKILILKLQLCTIGDKDKDNKCDSTAKGGSDGKSSVLTAPCYMVAIFDTT